MAIPTTPIEELAVRLEPLPASDCRHSLLAAQQLDALCDLIAFIREVTGV